MKKIIIYPRRPIFGDLQCEEARRIAERQVEAWDLAASFTNGRPTADDVQRAEKMLLKAKA